MDKTEKVRSFASINSEDGTFFENTTEVKVRIIQEYETSMRPVYNIAVCVNDSLWLGTMQSMMKIKRDRNNTKILSSFFTNCFGMSLLPTNDIIFSDGNSILKQIIGTSKICTNSIYSVAPFHPTVVHVTKDRKVMIAAGTEGSAFSAGRRIIIVLDKDGKQENMYELDKNNKPIFTYPVGITTTDDKYICVNDRWDLEGRGQLIILKQEGGIQQIYRGHPAINSAHIPFAPMGMAVTENRNIIISDISSDTLHILNSRCQFLTHYNLKHIGITTPISLCFGPTGHLYIGCGCCLSDINPSKLYKVEITGC